MHLQIFVKTKTKRKEEIEIWIWIAIIRADRQTDGWMGRCKEANDSLS